MYKENKSGGAPQGFARLPIRAGKYARSIFLLLLLITSCEKIDLTPGDATVPDDSSSSLTATIPTEVLEVDAIPAPCTLWRGHVVALVEPINGSSATPPFKGGWEGLITLLSLHEWNNLPSALNTADPTVASTLADSYQEYDLTHWRIPTTAQAKALKAAYPAATVPESVGEQACPEQSRRESTSSGINTLLLQAEGIPLTPSARYLCEEGTKSFSFAPGSTISTAGAKATTYRLRLVRTLRLKQK